MKHFPICNCHIIPDVVFKELKKKGVDVESGSDVRRDQDFRVKRTEFMMVTRMLPDMELSEGKADRYVYNSQNTGKQKLKLERKEGNPDSKDVDVNAVYESAGIVRDYFKNQLEWDSIDGNGMDLIFNVHYMLRYNNAFWDGEQMTFGDGDGVNFTGFTKALDVTGHELTHGVVQYTAGLIYKNQSGALNEHFADVFGVAIAQFNAKQTAQTADWGVGASCMLGKFKGKAIRSMKSPGDLTLVMMAQPDHMDKIYKGTNDNGGVHINSGIPNKAFYLVSLDIGTQVAAKLWFEALKLLKPSSKFKDLHKALTTSTKALALTNKVPANTIESVNKAFTSVGIIVPKTKK